MVEFVFGFVIGVLVACAVFGMASAWALAKGEGLD